MTRLFFVDYQKVADIKRINGLVMDLQMFAHKSLLIPLPGRHPPSPPIRSNGFVDNRYFSHTACNLYECCFLHRTNNCVDLKTIQNLNKPLDPH